MSTIKNQYGESQYSVGTILIVFFGILIAIFNVGQAAPFFGTLTTATAAAYEVFHIIQRVKAKQKLN